MKKSAIPEVKIKLDEDGQEVLDRNGQHVLEHPVIFVSEYRGLGVLSADGTKPICRFTPFAVMHPTKGQISKGHYLCMTKEIFDQLISHAGMNKSYVIIKRLPRETDRRGNILTRAGNDGKRELHELNEDERNLYRQLTHLEAQYFTKESNFTEFKDNIRKDETKQKIRNEVNTIKRQLKLKEV